MAWGYEKSFVVEHVEFPKKKLSCKVCEYYEKDDKSCMKKPLYLPEDGYDSWKHCKYFEPNKEAIKKKMDGVEKYTKKLEKPICSSSKHITESQKGNQNIKKIQVHPGDTVNHISYGKGKVVSVSDKYIVVSFNGAEKKYQFPGAFEKGFLKK